MKAALIGLGMVSRTYGDAFRNSPVATLGPVYARGPEARQKFLTDWPDLGATDAASLDDAISGAAFVIVTTPPNARAEIVASCIAAGKPVLMEKPIERTLAAAAQLVEACEAAALPLGIVLQHRARAVVADLRREMASLGDLCAVEVNIPWWRPQSYYDEPGRGSYARDGGGVLISQAIHILDLMLSLTGPVAEVTAMTATTSLHRMESEDFVSAGLAFANGAVGHLYATTASFPGTSETITLHCRDGSASLARGTLHVNRHDGKSATFGQTTASGAGADPMAFTSDWHRAIIEDFVDSVATGRPPLVPGRTALEVHALIAAMEASAREKRAVSLV